MKRIGPFVLYFFIMLFATSCSSHENISTTAPFYEDDSISLFRELWDLPGSKRKIDENEVWDTDYYSIRVVGNTDKVTVTFSSENYAVDKALENGTISIHAASNKSGDYSFLFDTELFYMMALLEDANENFAKATFSLNDDPDSIMIIVVVDGVIRKADYMI